QSGKDDLLRTFLEAMHYPAKSAENRLASYKIKKPRLRAGKIVADNPAKDPFAYWTQQMIRAAKKHDIARINDIAIHYPAILRGASARKILEAVCHRFMTGLRLAKTKETLVHLAAI